MSPENVFLMSNLPSPEIIIRPENVTDDPRFLPISDRVPVIYSWGIEAVMPRPGLATAAVVQRAAQLYSPYYETSSSGSYVGIPPENLGIGLEDKLLGRVPAEGMAKFFAREAANVKDSVRLVYPGHEDILDELVAKGEILNGGSESGRLQLHMLAKLDKSIADLVARLNKGRTSSAFNFRQEIYDYLSSTGISESRLLAYKDGKRTLVLPRAEELGISGGKIKLEEELRGLSEQELADWKFLRSALFILFDPNIREIYEANSEIDSQPFEYDEKGRRVFKDIIARVVGDRIAALHRKNN